MNLKFYHSPLLKQIMATEPSVKMDFVQSLIPGTVGALCNNYGAYPFDTIRVRLQSIQGLQDKCNNRSNSNRSTMAIVRRILRNGLMKGVREMYRGSTASAIGMIAENSIVFSANRIIKRNLYGLSDETNRLGQSPLTFRDEAFVGFISGSLSTLVSCPFETIRSNMQVESGVHRRSSIMNMARNFGVSGLYRGFVPSYFRNVPFYMLFFPLYSEYANLISQVRNRPYSELGVGSQIVAGGMTGATTWMMTYPMDFIKCNQQITPIGKDASARAVIRRMYGETGSVFKTFVKMYRGVGITMVRAFPASGSLMVGVELANSFVYDK